ncbi:MAG: hypothetical protein K1X86_00215 [Ignavibacteria bacterium]|nr:hypothetical protein [Ignavibacteria bacterium]
MKEKNSKSSISISSNTKDESDIKKSKNESKNKQTSSKDTERPGSKNDFINSILNEPRKSSNSAGWESGIRILDSVKVIIPLKLLLVCNQIAERLNGEEFSILVNLSEKENVISLSQEYYIPRQVVSSSSIDYIPEDYCFNTVIHRHPDGMNSFSSTDRNFINQNFKLSILYTHKEGFVHGIYNLKHDNYLVQIPIEISVDMGLELIDIQNIQTVHEKRKEIDRKIDFDDDRSIGYGRAYGSIFDIDKEDLDLPFGRSIDRRLGYRGKRRITENSDEKTSTFDLEKDGSKEEKQELKKLEEENLDYGLIKRMILEDVNNDLEEINLRLSNVEDVMHYAGYGMI